MIKVVHLQAEVLLRRLVLLVKVIDKLLLLLDDIRHLSAFLVKFFSLLGQLVLKILMKLSCHLLVMSLLFVCLSDCIVQLAELVLQLLQHVCHAAGENCVALVRLAEHLAKAELLVNRAEPEVVLVVVLLHQPGIHHHHQRRLTSSGHGEGPWRGDLGRMSH